MLHGCNCQSDDDNQGCEFKAIKNHEICKHLYALKYIGSEMCTKNSKICAVICMQNKIIKCYYVQNIMFMALNIIPVKK